MVHGQILHRSGKRWCMVYPWGMNTIELLLPDFGIILLGYGLGHYTKLNEEVWKSVEILVYFLLFPVLLFSSINKSPLDIWVSAPLIEAGLMLALCTIALSYSLVHLPWIKSKIDLSMHAGSAQVAFRFNSFIALALAQRLFGEMGLIKISILLGITIPLLNVAAVWPMAKNSELGFLKELSRNPLVLATLSAMAFNLLGLHLPSLIDTSLSKVGAASIPLGLMAAGASLHLGKFREELPLSAGLLSIRHAIAPVLAFFLATQLGLPPMEGSLLIVFSALPTASSSFVLTSRMGFDGHYVAGLVTLSTLFGMASLSFAFFLIHQLY